ncbi:hypothetical protein GOP47_0006677 [Adiantum capillus-veneris]|uniref:Uncharacterized protein n=1 Tax=Adiantum capillus-veneris TaxID=13818 RepID=A0A9D4V3C0_ADICA|nr:hypothetical protein GOP47_0006677 [Adiantum capillus-veneris]
MQRGINFLPNMASFVEPTPTLLSPFMPDLLCPNLSTIFSMSRQPLQHSLSSPLRQPDRCQGWAIGYASSFKKGFNNLKDMALQRDELAYNFCNTSRKAGS